MADEAGLPAFVRLFARCFFTRGWLAEDVSVFATVFLALVLFFGLFAFFNGKIAGGRTGLSGSYSGWFRDLGPFGVPAVGFGVHLVAFPVTMGALPKDAGVCGSESTPRK